MPDYVEETCKLATLIGAPRGTHQILAALRAAHKAGLEEAAKIVDDAFIGGRIKETAAAIRKAGER